MKKIYSLLLLSIILIVQTGFAKPIDDASFVLVDDFVCPGMPQATYTYTENGWIDSGGNSIQQPEPTSEEPVNILADFDGTIIGGDINTTFYVGPGATFSGILPKFVGANVIIEGTMERNALENINSDATTYHICSTGSIEYNVADYSIDTNNIYHNAGNLLFTGILAFNSGVQITNYSGGVFTVEGEGNDGDSFKVDPDSRLINYGKIIVNNGNVFFNGNTEVVNHCTMYVKNDITILDELSNFGLLLIEGSLVLEDGIIYNSGIADFGTLVVSSTSFEGVGDDSLIVIRESATMRNGGAVTGTKYFDLNNGGGFDTVCETCTEDITVIDSLEIPEIETYINECGAGINVESQIGSISGTIYEDENNSSDKQPNESGIAGVSILITDADGVEQTVLTDASGVWIADSVTSGTAQVFIDETTLPTGKSTLKEGVNPGTVEVVANATADGGIAGFYIQRYGTISGLVYNDINGNGEQNDGEPGIANVLISITDGDLDPKTVLTDANGNWKVVSVNPGRVLISIDSPTEWDLTQGGEPEATVIAGGNVEAGATGYNIPVVTETGTVSGLVYEDEDNSKTKQDVEPGIANVSILVTDGDGVVQTVVTDANGNWVTSAIVTGTAQIEIDTNTLPSGWVLTQAGEPEVTVIAGLNVVVGETGYNIPVVIETGTVSGLVYNDENGDGDRDPVEPGIANVSILITDADGVVQTVVTDAEGNWVTTAIVTGKALIEINSTTLPANSTQIQAGEPEVTVIADENVVAGAAGYNIPVVVGIETGNVFGLVYEDLNDNEFRDPGEPGIANVLISVIDADQAPKTTLTDADGNWEVRSITAGDATVLIDQDTLPDGITKITEGDQTNKITVVAGGDSDEVRTGVYIIKTGTIRGFVYEDENSNGSHDEDDGELGIANVSIFITGADGVVQTVETNAEGNWEATSVILGDALVEIDLSTLPVDLPEELVDISQGSDTTIVEVPAGGNVDVLPVGISIEEEEEVEVDEVSVEVVIYNAISPNSDGINDEMVISGIENYSQSTLMIFNRWYQQIYKISNCGKDDNTFKGYGNGGEVIPSGTYTYILKYYDEFTTKKDIVKSGHLYIER